MTSKRNIKMYISQKSTIVAFGFFIAIIILLITTFTPMCTKIKGVRDNFSSEEIQIVSSNNYNTTYIIGKDNNIYYSYNKEISSHLNNFAGIVDLSNEYGDATTREYNFIKIEWPHTSKIVKVLGKADDVNGRNGYTLMLSNNGNLYIISTYTGKNVELLIRDVKDVTCQFNHLFVINSQNDLFHYELINSKLINYGIIDNNCSQGIYCDSTESEGIVKNSIFSLSDDKLVSYIETYNSEELSTMDGESMDRSSYQLIDYSSKTEITKHETIKEDIKKVVSIDSSSLILTSDNKLYGIDNLTHIFGDENNLIEISNELEIVDIYTTGEYAYILSTESGNYYLGDISINDDTSYNTLQKVEYDGEYLYSSSNGIFLIDNGYIYLYNKETLKFEPLYENYIFTVIIRYLSLFILAMIVFYFILSFVESNKRYNRYFHANKNKS